jgi:hypothetical protein
MTANRLHGADIECRRRVESTQPPLSAFDRRAGYVRRSACVPRPRPRRSCPAPCCKLVRLGARLSIDPGPPFEELMTFRSVLSASKSEQASNSFEAVAREWHTTVHLAQVSAGHAARVGGHARAGDLEINLPESARPASGRRSHPAPECRCHAPTRESGRAWLARRAHATAPAHRRPVAAA